MSACGGLLIKSISPSDLCLLQATWLYGIQMTGLLLVCILQFFNSMILGSLLISFNLSVLIARKLQVGHFCVLNAIFFLIVWLVGPYFHTVHKGSCLSKFPLKSTEGIIQVFCEGFYMHGIAFLFSSFLMCHPFVLTCFFS